MLLIKASEAVGEGVGSCRRTLEVICSDTWISDTSDPTNVKTEKKHFFVPLDYLHHGLLDPG